MSYIDIEINVYISELLKQIETLSNSYANKFPLDIEMKSKAN